MKRLLLIFVLSLSACVYEPVKPDTFIRVDAQNYGLTLKDSSNGLYLFKSDKEDYLFKKDSTQVRLIEKYNTSKGRISIVPEMLLILIMLIFIILGVIFS